MSIPSYISVSIPREYACVMCRSNNMEKPGIIDSRFSGIRELCFSVYRLLCQSRQRRVVLLRTANRAMPAAASNAMATPYGAMAAPVSAVVVVVVSDWSPVLVAGT